jgi:hypothetical protein
MELFASAFLGGILGAILMDLTETAAARAGIHSGVTISLVGRWVLSMLQGQFTHDEIRHSSAHSGEVRAGWAFHFLAGGGIVALAYPLILTATAMQHASPAWHISHAVLFGLGTSILPWFILLPAFGWGMFGWRGPVGSNAVLASIISHIAYGLGIGLVMAATSLAH